MRIRLIEHLFTNLTSVSFSITFESCGFEVLQEWNNFDKGLLPFSVDIFRLTWGHRFYFLHSTIHNDWISMFYQKANFKQNLVCGFEYIIAKMIIFILRYFTTQIYYYWIQSNRVQSTVNVCTSVHSSFGPKN